MQICSDAPAVSQENTTDLEVLGGTNLPSSSAIQFPDIPPAGLSVHLGIFRCLSANLRKVWSSLKPLWNALHEQGADFNVFKVEVQSNFEMVHDKLDTLLRAAKLPVPKRRTTTIEVQAVEPQVGSTYRVTHLRSLDSLNIKDIWEEWTVGVDVGGSELEAPLKKLEANKKNTPYRDPSNKGLKTAVLRRVDIASHLEKETEEIQQKDGGSYDDAIKKAIEQAELTRKTLGKQGKSCSLFRFWEHIKNYSSRN